MVHCRRCACWWPSSACHASRSASPGASAAVATSAAVARAQQKRTRTLWRSDQQTLVEKAFKDLVTCAGGHAYKLRLFLLLLLLCVFHRAPGATPVERAAHSAALSVGSQGAGVGGGNEGAEEGLDLGDGQSSEVRERRRCWQRLQACGTFPEGLCSI